MEPTEYLEHCRLLLISSPVIQSYTILEAYANDRRGYIRARATLTNGDFLEVAEFFVLENERIATKDYRYQWMDDSREFLRRRWDNTPHFPDLVGFPDHVHDGSVGNVQPGEPMNLARLLSAIAELLRDYV